MEDPTTHHVSSRSVSPEASTHRISSPVSHLPEPGNSFFESVSPDGFTATKNKRAKAQPWKENWSAQQPTPDGKLIVACPKVCTYGSNNLGGY